MTSQSEGLSALHQIIEGSNVSKAQLKHLLHQFVDKFCIDEKTVAVGQELLDATRDLTIEKVSQVADPKAGKKKKEIQFDKCRFRHIALQIQYDGSKYHGFASQESTETVENCLFDVLVKLKLIEDAKNCQYTRCGRTDKGVSAMGQIVALKIRSAISPNIPDEFVPLHPGDIINYPIEENHKTLSSTSASLAVTPSSDPTNVSKSFKTLQEMDYCTMINALLPEDIRIIGWSPVTDNFSSRFSATYRTYRYFFHKENLNISSMITACSYLIGSHDFRNFCKLDIANVTNFIREIFSAEIICYQENYIKPELSIYYLQIKGIAFLWHMVRCIMSVLFLIGEEKEEPSIIHHLFNVEKYPSKPSYAMADDAPLVLQKCGFDNLVIYHTPKTLWNLTNHYQQLRNKYLLAAARAQNAVDTLYSEAAVRSQDLEPFLLHLKDLKEGRKDNRNHPSQKNLKNQNKRKFDDLLPSENSLDTTPMVVENTAADFISWKETLQKIYEETRLSPSEKTSQYIPLLERKKEESYEERVNKLAGQKKERFDRHIDLSESAKDTTPQFFDTMRKEGTLLRENR